MTVAEERTGMLVAVKSRFLNTCHFVVAYVIADALEFSDRCSSVAGSCRAIVARLSGNITAFAVRNAQRIRSFGSGVIAHAVSLRSEAQAKWIRKRNHITLAEHQEALGAFAQCANTLEMQAMDFAHRLGNKEKRVMAFLDLARTCQRLSRESAEPLKEALENLKDSGRAWSRDQRRVMAASEHARSVAVLAARAGYREFGLGAYELAQEYGARIETVLEQIAFSIQMSDIAPDYMPDDQRTWLTRALELATGVEALHARFDAVNTVVHKMVGVHIAPQEHMRLTDLLLNHVAGPDDALPEDVDAAFDDMSTGSDDTPADPDEGVDSDDDVGTSDHSPEEFAVALCASPGVTMDG